LFLMRRAARAVLVVDDDGDWRALVADTLAEEGFVVATASDGRAACDCVRRVHPDVVVTDVEMPLMDGYELLARLRCLDHGLPIIVMSANDGRDTSRFSDAFRFIPKPATIDAVTVAVKDALHRRRRTRLRDLWTTARAAAGAARERGYAIIARTMDRRRRSTKAAVVRRVRPDTRRRTGGRSRFAVLAGVGVVTVAAFVIAAIRGAAA